MYSHRDNQVLLGETVVAELTPGLREGLSVTVVRTLVSVGQDFYDFLTKEFGSGQWVLEG